LVNFVGGFVVTPALLKHHHNGCSYADTIMPGFFLAVGFAYRMTFVRSLASQGTTQACWKLLRRCLGLMLIALVVYHLGGGVKSWSELETAGVWGFVTTAFKRNFFQTLTHIAVTSLWVLPVIAAGPTWRVLYAAASAALHVVLSFGVAGWSNYDWVHQPPVGIDGGPLGFLTWTIPLVAGSLAFDLVASTKGGARNYAVVKLLVWGFILMACGYLLECLVLRPATQGGTLAEIGFQWAGVPFLPRPSSPPDNLFRMSQRAGSVSYLTFATGVNLALYAFFVLVCDGWKWELGLLRTFGTNALAAYVLHDLIDAAMSPWLPRDSPAWYVALTFAVFLGLNWLFVRYLEKRQMFLRL
jgi:hypothetical protein